MAFFKGNYGSSLARIDTQPIIEAGRAQGQMYANMGAQLGGMIQQYGLNKQKRAKLTGEIEAYYQQNPEALSQIGMSGDEAQDKKDFNEREKFVKGDMSMAQLEGYAGKLARGEVLRSKKLQDESRVIQNQLGEQNLGLQERLEDSKVENAQLRNVYQGLSNDLMQLSKDRTTAIQGPEITAIIDKYADDAGLREIRAGIEGEKLLQQEQALKVDPLVDQVGRQRRQEQQALKKNQLMLDAAVESESVFPASERAKLERKGLEVGIKKNRNYMNYLDSQINRQSIPANKKTEESISEITKEIDSILKSPSFAKNEDDESLDIEDLVIMDPISGEMEVSELANNYAQADINRLKELVKRKYQLRLGQMIKVTDENGEITEVTVAEWEAARKAEEARLLKIEQEKQKTKVRKDFQRAGGSVAFGQSRL
jgi:hypothetical protein